MLVFSGLKNKLVAALSFLSSQRKVRRGLTAVLFLLLITSIMALEFVPEKTSLVVGQVSTKTFKADRNLVFEYEQKTAEQRRLAAEKADKVYAKDPQVSIAVQKDISDLSKKVRDIQGGTNLDADEKAVRLRSVLPFVMSEEDITSLTGFSAKDTQAVENSLNSLVGKIMDTGAGIAQDQLDKAKETLNSQISGLGLAQPYESYSRGVVERFLRPNTFIDYEKTKQKQDETMAAVPPTMITVKEGEKVKKGIVMIMLANGSMLK
jgi:membrane-associated HD superfamily phosphohydrolase